MIHTYEFQFEYINKKNYTSGVNSDYLTRMYVLLDYSFISNVFKVTAPNI